MPDSPEDLLARYYSDDLSPTQPDPPGLPPYWGETQWRGPWSMIPLPEKDSPAAHSILDLIGYLSMVLPGRSVRGAGIGRDAILANRYWKQALRERPYFGTGDITGGRPNAEVSPNTRNWAPWAESSSGLVRDLRGLSSRPDSPFSLGLPRPGMRPASLPDQMMIFPETIGIDRMYPSRAYSQPEGAFWPLKGRKPAND